MNYIKIKFFPSKIDDYLYFFLSNIIFVIILTSQAFFFVDVLEKEKKNKEVMLFIPKIEVDFEEKRDLIFNQLSINNSILSVNKVEEKNIKALIIDFLEETNLDDDSIPEVYDLDIDKKKPLDIELINKKISIIIEGSMILKLGLHNKNTLFIFFSIFLATILTILLTNFFLTRNYFFKLSDYFYLSIKFGVRDTDIVKNLNITFLILLVLVYLISYPITMLILNFYFNMILINEYTIKAYVMIFLLYTFIFLALLSIQCILNIRSLNKL